MKWSLVIQIAIVVFGETLRRCDGASGKISDKIDVWWIKNKMRNACKHVYSKTGNAIMNMGRILNYDWMRTKSLFANKEFILGKDDAAYFFRNEQKTRDQIIVFMKDELERRKQKRNDAWKSIFSVFFFQRAAIWFYHWLKVRNTKKKIETAEDLRIHEYFCENSSDQKSLNQFCELALMNKKLQEKIPMRIADYEKLKPVCEINPVSVPLYDFHSERNFLKCPVIKEGTDDEPELHTYIYISSVEDPPLNRMRFYLFMSPLPDQPVEPSKSPPSSPPKGQFQGVINSSPDRQYKDAKKSAPTSPTSPETVTFQGVNSNPTSPDRQTEKKENGFMSIFFRKKENTPSSPPSRTVSQQDVNSRPRSPDNKSENDKKGVMSMFFKRKSDKPVPLRIVTLVLNKDTRSLLERQSSHID